MVRPTRTRTRMYALLVALLVGLDAVQGLAVPRLDGGRRAAKASMSRSGGQVDPSPTLPIAHGSYNLQGHGIHGPPASAYTVLFRPGGRTTSLAPSTSSSSSPSPSSRTTSPPEPTQTATANAEAARLQRESGRETFAKSVPAVPKVFRDAAGAEVAVDEVVQRVMHGRGIAGRRARQLVVSSLNQAGRNGTAALQSLGLSSSTRPAEGDTSTASSSHRLAAGGAPTSPRAQAAAPNLARLRLTSSSASYALVSIRRDLHLLRAWAGDLSQLSTPELLDETVAAIASASARYYPDIPTLAAARLIMADILAESDFRHDLVSGARLDSGSAWGLMQVSPFGSGQELKLFREHAVVDTNSYSWSPPPQNGGEETQGMGALLDWATGKVLDPSALKTKDLLRPWVNIHIASWIQSNLARTASQDPYSWTAISRASRHYLSLPANATTSARQRAWDEYASLLAQSPRGIKTTFKTGLGSWVAGPAASGSTGYAAKGDDISKQYFDRIATGLSVLYGSKIRTEWMDTLRLTPGLVDFR
ncbi:uncharacterized protein PFL1_00033 [Pseudozyma flocculosa PF-1]|uniref:Transglycosylase SLT domain-containing protein n=1 Tax=Pseudozyma flocculosa TaxID=84751 RepID=A0A5C3ESN4_9BASI|nr:uncharacterized protein PFL1_00033 [Pseudozyma flocculosa PF-1]EPQ31834.1 hypothetical protein PFL1_00033 [Pseudozyma flocculosa PF-1]SPO35268.1 uncharacterized protein PSFLO_00739 [Pseudozyma flocculosa]